MNRWTIAGAAAGLLGAALVAMPMGDALSRLTELRARHQAQATRLRGPMPTGGEAFRIEAGSADKARALIERRVRGIAGTNGVLVETMEAAPPPGPGLVRLRVGLSGSEKAVLGVGDAIERSGGVRWDGWRLTAPSPGSARIEGELVAAWR